MAMCRKTKIKWAGIIAGTGAVVTGTIVPLVNVIKSDEKELHQDESVINDLNGKIIDQATNTNNLIDNIRQKIADIYKDVGEVSGKMVSIENAINLIMRVYVSAQRDSAEHRNEWVVD